jgi:hypothetical protein
VASAAPGAGGDVMKWLLGDFKQLAKNSEHAVRIWAYTNKAENVYNARNPIQPGFFRSWAPTSPTPTQPVRPT